MNNTSGKLVKNTALLAIGSFASSLLGMLFIPFYTSVLSTSDYGISDLIITTTALLYPFLSVAISESIMRFSLDKNADHKSIYSIGIYTVTVGFIILLIFSPIIKNTVLGPYLKLFLLYFAVYCLQTITSYFVKGIEKITYFSIGGLIGSITIISLNLFFLLFLKIGITGYLLSSIIGHSITTIYLFFSAKLYKYMQLPWKINFSLYKRMLIYSLPILPNSISWWISNSSDKYILNYFSNTDQVGIYSVSYKIPTIMMTLMGFFISAWQISCVDSFGSEESKKTYSDVYNKCVIFNVLLALFLIITAKPLGNFLYSNDFFVAWRYVPILILANIFNILSSFIGTIYTSSKNTKMLAISTVIAALLNIVFNFLLIPFFGAMGAAIATAIAYITIWIIRIINTRKIMEIQINHKRDIFLFFILFIAAFLVIFDTLVTSLISYLLFFVMLIFFRKYISEMIIMILNIILRRKGKRSK